MDLGHRESSRGGVWKTLRRWIAVAIAIAVGYGVWVKFEWWPPTAALRTPLEFIGHKAEIHLDVLDRGSGLKSVEVVLEAAGTRFQILSEIYPAQGWRGSGLVEKSFDISFAPREVKVPEGRATLVVRATDFSWLNFFHTRPPVLSQAVEVDYTPPSVEVLTSQHYMRLGGSDMVVYRTSKDVARSGVEVDRYFFPGTRGLFPDPDVATAMFAVPYDLTTQARPKVVAEDRAGNRREADFHVAIKPRKFAERTLEISDDFLKRKVPDLLRINNLPPNEDLVAGYLEINRTLRERSEAKIREVCGHSEPKLVWSEVFLRQLNSAPLSNFADHRTYVHNGEIIDSQRHLGYDLASVHQDQVTAENDGKVVFAENLGIYGNAVILDHGLGIFTLYGHLSSIGVEPGRSVKRGDVLGRTGETGLAAGDHLHFSVMIDGVHVDPVEWWDPKWLDDHILGKMKEFASPPVAPSGVSGSAISKGESEPEKSPAPHATRRKRRR